MQGCKQESRWHSQHSPFEQRVYRTVAMTIFACVVAVAIMQGCRGQLNLTNFSSPSSEAGRRYGSASGPLSQRNYLSASTGRFPSFRPTSIVAGLDGHQMDPGKAATNRADSRALEHLLDAIALVESNNRANAVGDGGSAVGAYQIRPIFLRDINRILGWDKYELADRFDPEKSRAMARVYLDHYGRGKSTVEMARQFNGGPSGHLKKATEPFAIRIQAAMDAAGHGQGGPF